MEMLAAHGAWIEVFGRVRWSEAAICIGTWDVACTLPIPKGIQENS